MTFEKKTLVLMSILGPLDPSKISFLSTNLRVFPLGTNRHVVLFGSLARQENDAEEALTHALELQSADRKIIVSTESVLFENQMPKLLWLDSWNQTFNVLKDGAITISLDLVRIYQRIFDIQASKTKHETLFLLKGKKANPSRIRGLQKKYTPLVGRKKELSTLMEVIEQSFEDQGQIASIIGDAGLGKTRLKFELTSELQKKDIKVLEGYFSLSSDLNFRGFHQLVQQMLENNTETFSKWSLNDSESAFLRYFLHPEEKHSIVKDLNEQELTQGVFHSIQKLFSNAGQNPTVLILDDFHWADEKSVQLMELLSQSMEKTKLAFFLIHRPTFQPSFHKRLNYHQIKLSPLKHEETKELVKNALHLDFVTEGAIDTLSDLSLGNPLYVEEVLRELISQKKLNIQKSDDVLRLLQVQFPQGAIPSNIHSLITARLDLLSKEAKEILQWVCVFGYRENQADFELFLQMLGLSVETFHTLFDQDYLEEASMFPEHKYKFHHDLLYETVKQSITDKDWIAKNQVIAEFLTKIYQNEMIIHGDRIAEFYMKGNMDAASFAPIFQAACIALEQKRYPSAIRYFDECYKLFSKVSQSVEAAALYEPYLEAIFASGDKEKMKTVLQAWEQEGFPNLNAEVKFYKINLEFLYTYRDLQKLLEVSKKAIDKVKNQNLNDIEIIFEVRKCQALIYLSKFDEAIHVGMQLLKKLNNNTGHEDLKINLYYNLGFVLQQIGNADAATYYILIAKEIADRLNNFKLKTMIHKRIGYLATGQGYYKESVRIWSDLIYMCQNQGFLFENDLFKSNRLLNNFMLGSYQTAIEESPSMEVDRYDWDKNFTILWTVRSYLEMGAYSEFKSNFTKRRYFPQKDALISGHKFHLLGNYHSHHQEFKKAELNYRRAKNIYQKHDYEIYAFQMRFLELRCKVLQNKISKEDATKEFDLIASNKAMRKHFYLWNTQMMSFFFARHGCNIRFKPTEDIDPMNCNASYLRMQMFVEKIKWLESLGEKEKASKLKEQYLAHRQEMSFYVPDEFKKSYAEHPFYQV